MKNIILIIFKIFVKCNDDLPSYIKNPIFHAVNEYDKRAIKGETFLTIFVRKNSS